MRAVSHTVTGAVIAVALPSPWLALPLAAVSHFILDAMPHYGSDKITTESRAFTYILAADTAMAAAFLLFLAVLQPSNWMLAAICGVIAASPDLMWLPKYISALRGREAPKEVNALESFHSRIQWYERPPGLIVEALWLPALLYVFLALSV